MDQPQLFCNGQELSKLAVSSGLLHLSWSKILELFGEDQNQDLNLRFETYTEAKCTIIAFVASLNFAKDRLNIYSSTLQDESSLFRFLCSINNSSFSVHTPAIELFRSVYGQLSALKSQLADSEKPTIITGYSLGGSVAALFTLWLLDTVKPGTKRPLCITFGAPLIGDTSLQRILEDSIWNSCFLHVAATLDPAQKLLIQQDLPFKPIGTFLMCSELGCTCLEDPEMVLELLVVERSMEGRIGNHIFDDLSLKNYYTRILEHFIWMPVLKGTSRLGEQVTDSLRAGIMLQLEDIGINRIQEPQDVHIAHDLTVRMETRQIETVEKKKKAFDPSKKLNDMKIIMANLEWYKKRCRELKKINYYDFFKIQSSEANMNVGKLKRELTEYWKTMVEEAKKKPQSETAAFRLRWLGSGTNYRRMVEPLDIAEYYNNGQRDYRQNGRSQHYVQLEKWSDDEKKPEKGSRKRDLVDLLTIDSSFWADVEEALILCKSFKNRGIHCDERILISDKLIKFEKNVMKMIENCVVSPEIFLGESSFMMWWREYEMIIGSYSSRFTDFMKSGRYIQYGRSE